MRPLLPLLLLISIQVNSQEKLDVGKVIADKNFNCNNYTFIDPLYGSRSFIDSLYGIKNICESKNKIEIRFTTSYAPTPTFDIIILSYDNNKWSGRKFEFNTDTLYYDSTLNAEEGKVVVSRIKINEEFDSLVNLLTKNNLFSLPNLNKIKNKPDGPTCGLIHSLTFKVDNNYRTYQFANIEYYTEHSKKKIFKNYYNVFEILTQRLENE